MNQELKMWKQKVVPLPNQNELAVEVRYKIVGGEEVFTFNTILTPTR